MFELAAISIGDDGENVASVAGSAKLNFSNAGEILAKNVGVLLDGGSKLVKIDLLEEIEIRRGALAVTGIARVIEAGSVTVPGETTAGGASIDSRNHLRERFARLDVININRAVLCAALGDGDGDVTGVERGDIKIDGAEAFRVQYIRVYDDTLRFWREIPIEADQERLLFGGLEL